MLIGALWNAYACGYYIHSFFEDNLEIQYYAKPTVVRSEYESYAPCFSPDGKKFAFVANPYLAYRKNYSKICIYDVETANLLHEFDTGLSLSETQLQFTNSGQHIAFYEMKSTNAYVFVPDSESQIATLTAPKTIRYFAGHRLADMYALVHEDGVTIYHTDDNRVTHENDFGTTAKAVAERFIVTNEQHLAKPNDWV